MLLELQRLEYIANDNMQHTKPFMLFGMIMTPLVRDLTIPSYNSFLLRKSAVVDLGGVRGAEAPPPFL